MTLKIVLLLEDMTKINKYVFKVNRVSFSEHQLLCNSMLLIYNKECYLSWWHRILFWQRKFQNSIWLTISEMIALNLYWFELRLITVFKHNLYWEWSFAYNTNIFNIIYISVIFTKFDNIQYYILLISLIFILKDRYMQ